uniref:KIAA1755 n=1 Tax=Taeniopygia guttata TaxID=59729 RepID=A0A674GF55_TAEGU
MVIPGASRCLPLPLPVAAGPAGTGWAPGGHGSHSRGRSAARAEGGAKAEDAGSLDAAVQSALQALYPPFEATAPTVLGQVFRLLESSYQGDGLCCLLQFLIPAKRLFERLRQAACAPYFNRIFLHEGWPLCLHEKVVVHLAPLNPLLLRPGDFYLQAEPCEEHTARVTLKHLSLDLRSVEETPVPEATHALLFTNAWLEEVNSSWAGAPLHTCLVATENGVTPLPWSRIATPEFTDKPRAGADAVPTGAQHEPAPETARGTPVPPGTANVPMPYNNIVGTIPGCKATSRKSSQGRYPGLIKVEQAGLQKKPATLAVPSLSEIISQNLEGEYVDLLEQSQEDLDVLTRSLWPTCLPGQIRVGAEETLPWVNGGSGADAWPCGGALSSEESPCSPCLERKLSQEPGPHGPKCRQRDSYMAALQNPVSFGSGLMAAILEEPDSPGSELPPATPRETPAQHRKGAGSPMLPPRQSRRATPGVPGRGGLVQRGSPRLPSGSSHKFSFLKGARLGAAPEDERVSRQHEGAWKKMSAIYSPRMGRARAAGKGTNAATAAPVEERSLESSSCKNGPSVPSTGTAGREPPAWQDLHAGLLRSGIICLPGSSDRLGRALLLVTTSGSAWRAAWCSAAELARLILCLCSLPRQEVKNSERREAKDVGLTVVVDARKQPPAPVLFSALRSVQSVSPGCIHSMLLLAEKELVSHREKLPGVQVETLTSLKALGRHIDSSQLPPELDGAFPYCHGEWVQFFQKLQPFTASLRRASELLQRCIQELRNTDALAGTQDAAAGIRRHQELMQEVLSDPQLARVQREGGFLLARLHREAAHLCSSDHARFAMELAEGLYSQLEEELHNLVSQSNSCLEHLKFLRKVRELETEFGKLGSWLDGEAAARLQEMGTEDWSPDSCQGSAEHFKEFLTQATARYQHGLTLCQEAAEVRAMTFPEADAFQVSAALFQTKLMSFSKQLERRQAERELLQELVRFSNKVAGLKLDCRQCSARAQRGEGQALRCLQRSFQKLSVEFALEKLKEMKAQVRRMQSSHGLAAWTEAQHRYQETRQVLEEMLAELQEAWGAQADGQGDSSSPPSAGSAAPHMEVPVCRAAPSPEPAVLGGRGLAEQPETSTEGPGQSPSSTTPGSTLGVEQSSLQPHCQLGPQGARTSHHHISADTPHPKPKSKASLGVTGHLTQEHSQPPRRRPFSLPPWTCFPGADPPCPTAVPHGTASDPSTAGAPVGPRAETAQYFQISSQSSFSSEDSDSQNSMEEAPAASLALPRDLQSPRQPCPSEKAHQIIYLENHHTESSAKANAK